MAAPLLDARGLCKAFVTGRGAARRTVQAVADLDIAIREGETHGLVGESGSGKTTTGRILLRLIEPDAGIVAFRGEDLLALQGAELRQMRRHIQLVYQDPFSSVDPRFRIRDIVAEPWASHGLHDRAERRRRADELLERVGIDPSQGDRRPASFSGGQLQRIGIVALALELANRLRRTGLGAGRLVQGRCQPAHGPARPGIAYLFIAHDLAVVRHISDRVSVMYAGRIVETARDQLFEAASHPYTVALWRPRGLEATEGRASGVPSMPATDDAPWPTWPGARSMRVARWRGHLHQRPDGHRGEGHPSCHFPVRPWGRAGGHDRLGRPGAWRRGPPHTRPTRLSHPLVRAVLSPRRSVA
jgi:ABC-type oligopeptide transport system ATPase subunit